jgi:hypothetical protein
MRTVILIICFCLILGGCVLDSNIEDNRKSSSDPIIENIIIIDLTNFNVDSLEVLSKIDSLNHIQIFKDFPSLSLNKSYDHFEPLRYYRELILFNNINSKLILYSHPAWGNMVFLLNYAQNGEPISAYKLISCGGDGGYYYCSKAKINGEKCTIYSEEGEPLSQDNYSKQIKTTEEKQYLFDSDFKLIIQDSTSSKDTL